MKTELLGQEKNIVRVKVDFEAGEFAASLEKTLRELSDKARIPGFRKGHISRKALEMRLGKEVLYANAFEKMLPGTIEQIVGDYELDTIDAPSFDFDIGSIQVGQPFSCELTFELVPAVSLPELEDIEVERLRRPEVTEEMIDATVAHFRLFQSTVNPVDRAAADGDSVLVSSVMQVFGPDGEVSDTRESEEDGLDLTENLRGEIREALLGKRKGDRAEAEFTAEDDHEDETLAGKRVRYSFAVKEVRERVLPEMGPEFYETVTGSEIESEDAFREALKKRILRFFDEKLQDRFLSAAVEQVVSRSELEVPDSLLKRQMDHVKQRDTEEVKRRFDVDLEDYIHRSAAKKADYEQHLREEAEGIVRRSLVLDKIGEKFGVSVTKEELEAEITRMAALHDIEPARLRALFYKDRNRLAAMADELRYGKITQLIAEKVRSKDVDKVFSLSSSGTPLDADAPLEAKEPPEAETLPEAAEGAE
jgi:trigger factor